MQLFLAKLVQAQNWHQGSSRHTAAHEIRAVIDRFLGYKLSFPSRISALYAALADFMPRMTGDQITRLRVVMLANNELMGTKWNGVVRKACQGKG